MVFTPIIIMHVGTLSMKWYDTHINVCGSVYDIAKLDNRNIFKRIIARPKVEIGYIYA